MGAVDQEGVRLTPAHDAALIAHHVPHPLADAAQDGVAAGGAEALVDHAEVVDVDDDSVHGRFRVVLVELLGVAVEILPAVKAREQVALGGEDDLPVLDKLDGAQDPCPDHVRLGVGLGDKVDGAESEALRFRRMVGGDDDDGDLRDGRVLLFHAQKLDAVHARHHQIQQHHGQRLPVPTHQFQRLQAVAGIERLVVLLEYMAQQLAVDALVVDDQDLPLAVGCVKFLMTFEHLVFPPSGCEGYIFTNNSIPYFPAHYQYEQQFFLFGQKKAPRKSGAPKRTCYSSSFFSSGCGSAAGVSVSAEASVSAGASVGISPSSA